MKKTERNISILSKRLDLVNKISVYDAMELLNVSESSARRIFAKMEDQNVALRVHGGLVRKIVKNQSDVSYEYDLAESVNLSQKKRIATQIAQIIADKNSIFLDSGSTVYRVSLALSSLLSNSPRPNLKVFTNSLKNLEVLEDNCTIKISGGDYRKSRHDLYGFIAENSLLMINFDACVIGADGIDFETGLTTTDFDTASLCIRAIKNSKYKILAVDSSKFNNISTVTFAQINDFDLIVTDDGISSQNFEKLKSMNIEVMIV